MQRSLFEEAGKHRAIGRNENPRATGTRFCGGRGQPQHRPLLVEEHEILGTLQEADGSLELDLILQAAHARQRETFWDAIHSLLTEPERDMIEACEAAGMGLQACAAYDHVFDRLSRRFAELRGFQENSLARVVERGTQLAPDLRCVVLELDSRGLYGRVAFKVSAPHAIPDAFPEPAIHALAETRSYWRGVAYLEPLYDGSRLIRSQAEARNVYCRPKDPILAGYLGSGPHNYGYRIPELHHQGHHEAPQPRKKQVPDLVFIVAHW